MLAGPDTAPAEDERRVAEPSPRHRRPARFAWFGRLDRADLAAVAALVVLTVVVEVVLRAAAERPLWYDELWRAHYLSPPLGEWWNELLRSNAPSSAGWAAVTRVIAEVFGWTPFVLRVLQLVTLPLLPVGTYLLGRRFTTVPAALVAAVLVTLGGKVLDLAMQVKPYSIEAICTVAMVGLWVSAPPLVGPARRWVGRRAVAGLLSLFSVPAVFLLVPLAASDVLLSRGALRERVRAGLGAGPPLVISAVHSLVFVRRQSFQRDESNFWDDFFLAGRGVGSALRFVWDQLVTMAGSAPPGVDRVDVNLVRAGTDGSAVETWLLAPAVAVCFAAGVVVLWRRRDGRVLLTGLLGAELLTLAASAFRFWPFGAARPNTFLLPLLALVPAIGLAALARRARSSRLLLPPVLVLCSAAVVMLGSLVVSTRNFAEVRTAPRLLDSYPVVTDQIRAQLRPDDLLVVGARLARAGWLYSTEVRSDRPDDLPELQESGPNANLVFIYAGGDGKATAALRNRDLPPSVAPQRVLLFVFLSDSRALAPEVAELRRAGWCRSGPAQRLSAGQLLPLTRC